MTSPVSTVSCPSCETTFPVDPAKVPVGGVHASCSKCGRVFPVGVQDGPGASPPAPSAPEASAPEASAPEGGTNPATSPRERAADPDGGATPRLGAVEGSKGGNGGAKVDEAADDFREWSSFRDLSFEPDDDPADAGNAVGATDTADSGTTREQAGPQEAGEGAEGSDAAVMAGEEPSEAADAPDTAHVNSVEATDSQDAAAGSEVPGGTEAPGNAADEMADTAADSDVAPEMNVTPEVDTTASREAPSEDGTGASPAFGRRDPHERAARLARVLASDMIAYNQDKYEEALKGGTLASDFEEEVEKSWEEYVEQVGKDMAEQNRYFQDALNEILAQGEKLF